MTREEIHKKIDKEAKSDSSMHENYLHILMVKMIVNEMFNYFEEELKKAYIEGNNVENFTEQGMKNENN